jgi:GLPGLI family protein
MKKIILGASSFFLFMALQGQQKQGKVAYDRTSQMNIRMVGNLPDGIENSLPKTRTDKFELDFGNNTSLWKMAEQEDNDIHSSGDGVQIKMVMAGNDDVLYTNFENGKRVEKREMFDKTFIVDDTISKLKWKMTGESKTILGFNAMKATATRISSRMMMNMDNGKMERKEVADTSTIEAWFTPQIPVAAGPAEYQGQLPGLILELDIQNGRQTFKATSVSDKADLAIIKEPTGKKHYTADEFKKERDKMLEEMQKNNQGGNRVIRMQ